MGQHGLINWADDDKECYDLTLELIEKAAPYHRAEHDKGATQAFGGAKFQIAAERERRATFRAAPAVAARPGQQQQRFIGTIQDDDAILRFVNSARRAAPGRARHLAAPIISCAPRSSRSMSTGIRRPAMLAALKKKLAAGLEQYRKDYAAYYEKCKHANSPAMRDPNPTVMLIPGLGLIAWGKDKSESRVTAEFYNCAIEVMRGAEAIDEYIALPLQEAFDIEYWLLEEAKLQPHARRKRNSPAQIVAVIGAGSGIGREVAHAPRARKARTSSASISNRTPPRPPRRKSPTSTGSASAWPAAASRGCGPAIGVCRATSPSAKASARCSSRPCSPTAASIPSRSPPASSSRPTPRAISPTKNGRSPSRSTSPAAYLVADEARQLWKEQGLHGSLVLTTSANAVVAKKGSVAYDTSKAAANHLVRELAIELAPLVRVNGVAPATVVQGSAMFPRDRVIASLAKYNIPYTEDEATESSTTKLAQFYADRTLTKNADHARRPGRGYFPAADRSA